MKLVSFDIPWILPFIFLRKILKIRESTVSSHENQSFCNYTHQRCRTRWKLTQVVRVTTRYVNQAERFFIKHFPVINCPRTPSLVSHGKRKSIRALPSIRTRCLFDMLYRILKHKHNVNSWLNSWGRIANITDISYTELMDPLILSRIYIYIYVYL